jgi:hypothetical protein
MEKQKLVGIILVCVVAFLAGYWYMGGRSLSAEKIKEKTLAGVDDVETYKFSTDITVNTTGELQGVPVDKLDVIAGRGSVDVKGRHMLFDVSVNSSLAGDLILRDQKMTVYLINNLVYFKSDGGTIKDIIPDSDLIWRDRTQVKQQARILAKSSVELVSEDAVRGEKTYVLRLTPPKKELVAYIAEQASVGGAPLTVSESQLTNLTGMVEDYSILLWVGKKDFLPRKFSLRMLLSSEELSRDTEVVMDTWDYGKPVEIKAPQGV